MRRIAIGLLCAATLRAGDAKQLTRARRGMRGDWRDRAEAVRILAGIDSRDSILILRTGIKRTARDLDQLGRQLDKLDDRYEKAIDKLVYYNDRGDVDSYNRWVDIHNAIIDRFRVLTPKLKRLFQVVRAGTSAFSNFRSEESVETLEDGARNEHNPLVRQAYIAALGQPAHEGSVPLLLELLEERDGRVRSAAVRALVPFVKVPGVVERVRLLAGDEDWSVRLGAYALVARTPLKVCVPFLVAAAAREKGEIAQAIDDYLEARTGQTFADHPESWPGWYEKHRAAIEKGTFAPVPKPKPKERRTRASFFSIPIESERLVFALDVSASMLEKDLEPRDAVTRKIMKEHELPKNRLGIAKAELIRAVTSLPDGAEFNIVAYSDYAKRMSSRLVTASRSTRRRAVRWVLRARSGFQTNVYDALFESFNDHMASSGGSVRFEDLPDTILFLTDGVPTRGRYVDQDSLIALVAMWNQSFDVAVHCVGIGKDHDRKLLLALARNNSGYYVDISRGTIVPKRRSRTLPAGEVARSAGTEVYAALARLEHEDWEKRKAAAEKLARLGPAAAAATAALVARLKDEDMDVQKSARDALVAIGAKAVPALGEALAHESLDVAENAAQALADLGEVARPAVPALLEALAGDRGYLCVVAARALGAAAEKQDPAVVQALSKKAEATTDVSIRHECLVALKKLTGE